MRARMFPLPGDSPPFGTASGRWCSGRTRTARSHGTCGLSDDADGLERFADIVV